MKIVLVIHHPLSWHAGAPGVVLSLSREFRELGHAVTVLSHDAIQRVPTKLRPLIFPVYCAWQLWRHNANADVIDASSGTGWLYFRLARQKGRGLYVGHSHGLSHVIHDHVMREVKAGRAQVSWKYPFFNGSLVLWQDAETFRSADLALFLNAGDREYAITKLRVEAARARVVPNGLSQKFLDAAAHLTPAVGRVPKCIVQVGSYLERKGIKTTAAALVPLLREFPDVKLTFLGTCKPAEVTLADYPEDLHGRIEVVPSFNNDALPMLLAQQDIFLMPSTSEGFPLAPMEAMACGLVPVVTDIPGPTEYIRHEENGLLIPVADPKALQQAVERLLKDEALFGRLRVKALEIRVSYRWSEIAAARLRLYREALPMKRKA